MLDDYVGLLIALGLALAASAALRRSVQWRRRALAAEGRVVDFAKWSPNDLNRGRSRFPIIAYETDQGEHVRFESNVKVSNDFVLGEAVAVLYDPECPERARIGKVRYVHFWAISLALLALLVGSVWVANRAYGF